LRKGELFFIVLSLFIVVSTPLVLAWEDPGDGNIGVISATPRITAMEIDKRTIEPTGWVTVTIRATNDGPDTAPYQTLHIGLPFDPPPSDIQLVGHDLTYQKLYQKGVDTLNVPGQGQKLAKYPVWEGYVQNWPKNAIHYLTIKVKMPDIDTITFDFKSMACDQNWNVIGRDPTSGMIDQQGEYVRFHLIWRKFTISIAPTGTQTFDIAIINHNRSPYAGTQPSITVTGLTVTNNGGFVGPITPTNLPLTISPGSTGRVNVRVTSTGQSSGNYPIQYKLSGTP